MVRLNSSLRALAEREVWRYRARGGDCLIGVHVRRTDYKKLLGETQDSLFVPL